MVSTVPGSFGKVSGKITYDGKNVVDDRRRRHHRRDDHQHQQREARRAPEEPRLLRGGQVSDDHLQVEARRARRGRQVQAGRRPDDARRDQGSDARRRRADGAGQRRPQLRGRRDGHDHDQPQRLGPELEPGHRGRRRHGQRRGQDHARHRGQQAEPERAAPAAAPGQSSTPVETTPESIQLRSLRRVLADHLRLDGQARRLRRACPRPHPPARRRARSRRQRLADRRADLARAARSQLGRVLLPRRHRAGRRPVPGPAGLRAHRARARGVRRRGVAREPRSSCPTCTPFPVTSPATADRDPSWSCRSSPGRRAARRLRHGLADARPLRRRRSDRRRAPRRGVRGDDRLACSRSLSVPYRIRVASAFVPAAQTRPPAFVYIARSTTIGAGVAPRLSTSAPMRAFATVVRRRSRRRR